MSKIILSICIPTYNRSALVSKCINQIICCQSKEIEIVISNNDSQDETEDEVKRIIDTRIKYYKNKKNLGFDANILKLVEKAKGNFLFFLSDEDTINQESLRWLLVQLKNADNENVTQVLGSIADNREGFKKIYYECKNELLKNGEESITQILFKNSYMSGIVLKRTSLDISHAKKYIGFSYMMQVLQAQAMISGNTLCTSKTFCYIGKKDKNYIFMIKDNVKGKNYTHPESRAYQLIKRINLVNDLNTKKSTHKLLLNKQRIEAALLIENTLFYQTNSFIKVISSLLKNKDLSLSLNFWLYVILVFPYKLIFPSRPKLKFLVFNKKYYNKIRWVKKLKYLLFL